jgi:DNA-binding response OmpR family regulator
MLCDDLIFASKVTGTARAAGLTVAVARNLPRFAELLAETAPAGVLLDLHHDGLDLPVLLAALRDRCAAMPRVTAFGSHVDAGRLKAAREAGCDLVLARSLFVKRLEADLASWLAPRSL